MKTTPGYQENSAKSCVGVRDCDHIPRGAPEPRSRVTVSPLADLVCPAFLRPPVVRTAPSAVLALLVVGVLALCRDAVPSHGAGRSSRVLVSPGDCRSSPFPGFCLLVPGIPFLLLVLGARDYSPP